jgi:hypothetical protein
MEKVQSLVRHILTSIGGMCVMFGVLDHDVVVGVIGGVAAIIATAWGQFNAVKSNIKPPKFPDNLPSV